MPHKVFHKCKGKGVKMGENVEKIENLRMPAIVFVST